MGGLSSLTGCRGKWMGEWVGGWVDSRPIDWLVLFGGFAGAWRHVEEEVVELPVEVGG